MHYSKTKIAIILCNNLQQYVCILFIIFACCSKLYHVRAVNQSDVYRADAKDIARIFQVLFYNFTKHLKILATIFWVRVYNYTKHLKIVAALFIVPVLYLVIKYLSWISLYIATAIEMPDYIKVNISVYQYKLINL